MAAGMSGDSTGHRPELAKDQNPSGSLPLPLLSPPLSPEPVPL